jgi:ATP-dependent DNA ligase
MTSSRLEKERICSENLNNKEFVLTMELGLSPYIRFYIKDIVKKSDTAQKTYNTEEPDEYKSLMWGLEQLSELSSRRVTGNAAFDFVRSVCRQLSFDDAGIIALVIMKDLRCGVSIKTINKVYKVKFGKNLIPEHPCMLASTEKSKKSIEFPALVQTKMDGMRANIIIKDGVVGVYGRSGKPIETFGLFDKFVQKMTFQTLELKSSVYDNMVIDGELLVLGNDGEYLDRKTGNGILNKAIRGTIDEEQASRIRMVAWDYIEYDEFFGIVDPVSTYTSRLNALVVAMDETNPLFDGEDLIKVIESTIVADFEDVGLLYRLAIFHGQEGVILKNSESLFENKRSKNLVKFKQELEMDLKVIGTTMGVGKYKNKLGALECINSDGSIYVSVGSGFSDAERGITDWHGKIVSVKYNEIIKSKGDKSDSLFLPIFVELRSDKVVPD